MSAWAISIPVVINRTFRLGSRKLVRNLPGMPPVPEEEKVIRGDDRCLFLLVNILGTAEAETVKDVWIFVNIWISM